MPADGRLLDYPAVRGCPTNGHLLTYGRLATDSHLSVDCRCIGGGGDAAPHQRRYQPPATPGPE